MFTITLGGLLAVAVIVLLLLVSWGYLDLIGRVKKRKESTTTCIQPPGLEYTREDGSTATAFPAEPAKYRPIQEIAKTK